MKSSQITFFQNIENLNEAQKNIIDAVIHYAISDIIDELSPEDAIRSLKAITEEKISAEEISYLKNITNANSEPLNVWDEVISPLRQKTIEHPCPQNRSSGDYNAALGLLGSRTEEDHPSVLDGVVDGTVWWFRNGYGHGLSSEPQGCWNLTARDDASTKVTKDATITYIKSLLNFYILQKTKEKEAEKHIIGFLNPKNPPTETNWYLGVAVIKDEKTKANKSLIYLEGLTENKRHFVHSYEIHSNPSGIITIKAKSLYPFQFYIKPDNLNIHSINNVQGQTLKNTLRAEFTHWLDKFKVSIDACVASSIEDSDYSLMWVKKKLEKIRVIIDESLLVPKVSFLQRIMRY